MTETNANVVVNAQKTEPPKLSPEQFALAVYLSVFSKTVDKLIAQTGHAIVMANIAPDKLFEVFSAFADADDPIDLFKKVKEISPKTFPSCSKTKQLYLRKPFEVGMFIAKQYFGTSDQKLVTGVSNHGTIKTR